MKGRDFWPFLNNHNHVQTNINIMKFSGLINKSPACNSMKDNRFFGFFMLIFLSRFCRLAV